MRTRLLLLPLLLGSIATAQNIYYVDAVFGSDGNPGTSRALAFQSITTGVSVLQDDDTLLVMPGTYSPTATGEIYPIQIGNPSLGNTQNRVRIVSDQGPAVTILDGEQQMVSAGVPMMRFRWDADGSSISGFTFQNTGNASYWTMVFRLGSTSGGSFATRNIEVYNNVFRDIGRAIVIFGTTTANLPNQTTGCKIHDNVIEQRTVGNGRRALAIWGDGQNAVYNNTIINPTHDGIYVDALDPEPTSLALIANNIVVGGLVNGIVSGDYTGNRPGALTATFENNNAFGNATDYTGQVFPPSNTSLDPLFAGAADFHLTAGSPMNQTGTVVGLPIIRGDHDNFSRLHDSDGDLVAGIDKGAYQFTDFGLTLTGTWAAGQTVNFNYTDTSGGTPGVVAVLFSLNDAAFPFINWGVLGADLLPGAFLTSVVYGGPGSYPFPIPASVPSGARLVMQGVHVGNGFTPVHLLNTIDRIF
jgi:hypothetical protein